MRMDATSLWECAIQAEETTTCGWALYSTNQLDQETLATEISKQVGRPVMACWRIISSGLQGNKLVSKRGQNDELRALHFECDVKDVLVVMPQLEKIYSLSGDGTYPLGFKLQLIPIINKVSNPRT